MEIITPLRKRIFEVMAEYSLKLTSKYSLNILDVGIAGDPKPSSNYKFFGKGNNFKTLDKLPFVEPDYVMDICETDFGDNEWDIVICSQTLEHIWDYKKALKEICRIAKKWAIIDIPFAYEWHPDPSFDDYWRFTPSAFTKLLKEAGFSDVDVSKSDNLLTTALCKK